MTAVCWGRRALKWGQDGHLQHSPCPSSRSWGLVAAFERCSAVRSSVYATHQARHNLTAVPR